MQPVIDIERALTDAGLIPSAPAPILPPLPDLSAPLWVAGNPVVYTVGLSNRSDSKE